MHVVGGVKISIHTHHHFVVLFIKYNILYSIQFNSYTYRPTQNKKNKEEWVREREGGENVQEEYINFNYTSPKKQLTQAAAAHSTTSDVLGVREVMMMPVSPPLCVYVCVCICACRTPNS